jgi:hypothetical protein
LTAALLAGWLVLLAASASRPLHNWLHGGAAPQDDDCAVVLLASGHVNAAPAALIIFLAPVVFFALAEIFSAPLVFKFPLPPGRGPPVARFLPVR